MRFEIVEIQPGDVVMTTLDIGTLPSDEVDKYVTKCMKPLKDTFGCEVAVLPVRGEGWDFIIIRNPNRNPEKKNGKLKKVDATKKS